MSPVSYVSNWALQWPDLKLTQAAPAWLRRVHLPRPQALGLTLREVTERSPGRGGTCLAKKTCVGECERTCQTPGRQSPSSGDSRSPWGWGWGLPWGSGWGGTSDTAALERETPLPWEVLFVYQHGDEKCAHPSKTRRAHTCKEPATLAQEGSGPGTGKLSSERTK